MRLPFSRIGQPNREVPALGRIVEPVAASLVPVHSEAASTPYSSHILVGHLKETDVDRGPDGLVLSIGGVVDEGRVPTVVLADVIRQSIEASRSERQNSTLTESVPTSACSTCRS